MTNTEIHTVFADIARHARSVPDKPAVVVGDTSVTYRMLADNVGALASALHALGVKAGDRVGVTTNNTIDHLMGCIAAMAAGGIAVALPNTDRVSYVAILDDASPSLVLQGRGPFEMGDADPAARHYHEIAELVDKGRPSPGNWLERAVRPDEIAMIYYTSGTSAGIRKGVMQSYRMLHNTAEYIVDAMRLTADVREFVASSLDNAFWFGRCRTVLKVGGTLLLHSGTMNPLAIIDAVKRNDGNAISGDTPVFLLLINHLEKNVRQIAPAIRWVKIASQPMPVADKARMLQLFPHARIIMGYGLTEAMRTTLLAFDDFPQRLASDGPPSPGVSLRIVDDQGTPLPAQNTGEVLIAGANMASGYWNKEEMWRERFDGTWYRSGDLGHLEDDGFLVLLGRKDDAINSGGKTIAPAEVENRLRPLLHVGNFAVCGIPDPKGILGDVIALCIEGPWVEKLDWKHLRIHLFEHMEPAFVPKEAYCIPAFPRTANGKIQIGALRQQIEQGLLEKM